MNHDLNQFKRIMSRVDSFESNRMNVYVFLTPLYACSINNTETPDNETSHSTTSAAKTTTSTPPMVKPILPVQTGVKAQEEEQSSGMSIFFSLLVIGTQMHRLYKRVAQSLWSHARVLQSGSWPAASVVWLCALGCFFALRVSVY